MQAASNEIRNSLWDRLKDVYNKYAVQGGQIATERVEEIVRDALGQTTKAEIDYVIKNMFRLDSDNSGSVSFHEFGNFLFKRHCGEMSLQKMHKENLIKHGAERKITQEEFWILLNKAYAFLKVECPRNICDEVFAEADKDQDGLITYVEYFKFIDRYICLTKFQFEEYSQSPVKTKQPEPEPQPVDLGRQWHSRLRLYLWSQLRHLYELYIASRVLPINDENLKGLIIYVLGPLSDAQLNFVLSGLYALKGQNLEFIPWALLFLYLVAELFLAEFQRNHPSSKKALNAEEFIHLLRNSFKFLKISRVKREVLLAIFAKIDKNNDGLITYVEYLDWVKRYLCVEVNRGDEFYTKEDDSQLVSEDSYLEIEFVPAPIEPIHTHHHSKIHFKFSDYGLAKRVRARVFELLVPFDANKDKKFDEPEIRNALMSIMKENEYEMQYFVRNVFRYDRDNDKNVTYDELTNFCVEQHFGEMAIQRLHRVGTYSRGKERVMSKGEFAFTLNNALSYIQMEATPAEIDLIWSEIDLDKNGWITYEVYFLFLRYYFGSLSGLPPVEPPCEETEDDKWKKQLNSLDLLQRFIRWIMDQLRILFMKYDFNKNLLFEPDEIEAILKYIFKLSDSEIQFIMLQFFKFQSRESKSLTFDELVRILISIYFIYFKLKNFRDQCKGKDNFGRINLEQFLILMGVSSFYLQFPFLYEDLVAIFHIIDTDHDGWITYREYIDFILKYLGNNCIDWNWDDDKKDGDKNKDDDKNKEKPGDIEEEEWDFVCRIWDELKAYFDAYDKGSKGYLNFEELKLFVIEVLEENTERELDYVMWNLFRVDPNNDCTIQFNEFAPFILKHAGQIALQRFHKHQILGKKNLTENELFIVFSRAFCFLKSMPKSQNAVHVIYTRIGKGSDPNYAQYLQWIDRALAHRYRK